MDETIPSPTFPEESRYALVVGVNGSARMMHSGYLKHAEDDAHKAAKVLQHVCGCKLVCEPLIGAHATTEAIRAALRALASKRSEQDLLLFYFAGHGSIHEDHAQQRQVYLVASDFDPQAIDDGEDTDSLSLSRLHERLYVKTQAGRVLLLLDCCYAGNSGRVSHDAPLDSMFALFKNYLGTTNNSSKDKYRVTIAATGHDAAAWENEQGGLMTQHLLTALCGECRDAHNEKGEVTVGPLYDFVHTSMPEFQKPSFSGDTAGKGLVLAKLTAHALHAQQQAKQQRERDDFLRILSTDPDGERFLRDRLDSFVGREKELHEIKQRIDDARTTGGYVTISGLLGQGKSSIIAALIAHGADTPHKLKCFPFHFIPLNPGPNYQVSLLRNLMARLIRKYGLSDLYVAGQDRPTLRSNFPKVLQEVADRGGQEVIYIDGLDQIERDANGVRDLTFLPTNPPEGIVFVLGTRPDDTLKPYTLLNYLLPPLSLEDFVTLLQVHNVPLMVPHFIEQFYEKTQKNAIYLALLARELHELEAISAGDLEPIVCRLAEDPDNIFSLALERPKRHTQSWHDVIRPLLGVLLVAQESLTSWQLRTILNLNHSHVKSGLDYLSGLVTDIEERYALYHLKFRDFLRQNEAHPHKQYVFPKDEEEELHARLVQWCERDQLSSIWQESPDPNEQSYRVYVRRHYISHLYEAHQWQHLFAVLDKGSYGKAKEHYDVETRSYIEDLRKGSQATIWAGWVYEQHIQYLPRLWKYTLLRCSIRSTVDAYPLELFEAMLALRKEHEVAGLVGLITRLHRKVEVLLLLARHLFALPERKQEGAAMYVRAEEVARSIEDSSIQAEALVHLASALMQAHEHEQARRLFEQAEEVVHSIEDSDIQTSTLVHLASALAQAHEWKQAKEVTHSIADSSAQMRVLEQLASTLAQAHEHEQAEEVARSIADSSAQAEALTQLASALAQAHKEKQARHLFEQAEKVARAIEDSDIQAMALVHLASALAQVHEHEQAEEVAHSIADSSAQAMALAQLASTLAQAHEEKEARHLFEQAEKVARAITSSFVQAMALEHLAHALAQAHEWKQAKEVIRSIAESYWQAMALEHLAHALAQAHEWKQAKEVIRSIEDSDIRASTLVHLASALAQAHEWKQAEEVAHSIADSSAQMRVLEQLASTLAQAHEWKQAEEVIRSIANSDIQVKALAQLASTLAQAHEEKEARRLLVRAEEVARSITSSFVQAEALEQLASALAQAHEWKQAEEVIRSIADSSAQARALAQLANTLAQTHEWEQAKEVIGSIENFSAQTSTLVHLASALAQAHEWKQAEEVARSIEDSSAQTRVLEQLASTLAQAHEGKQAEEVARSIADPSAQTRVLEQLANTLAQAHEGKQAEEVARSIADPSAQMRALAQLARALAHEHEQARRLFEQAEEVVVHSIEDSDIQAEALVHLASALMQAHEHEQARRLFKQAEEVVVHSIEDSSIQAEALVHLASALAQAHEHEQARRLFKQAEEVAHSIEVSYRQASVLAQLARALAQAHEWKQAKEVAHSIANSDIQARALAQLAHALAQAHEWKQAEEVVRSIANSDIQVKALAQLAHALAQTHEHEQARCLFEQAEEVARSIMDSDIQARALAQLVNALTEQGHFSHVLSVVQRSWQSVETRYEALQLFPLVSGLITQNPALGMELFEAFQWVDTFLRGS